MSVTDIYKSAGIIVRDKKLLITRTKGKPHFFSPGGKIEGGETPAQSLVRELKEELKWLTMADIPSPPLGSIFAHEVMPKLKEQGLIN